MAKRLGLIVICACFLAACGHTSSGESWGQNGHFQGSVDVGLVHSRTEARSEPSSVWERCQARNRGMPNVDEYCVAWMKGELPEQQIAWPFFSPYAYGPYTTGYRHHRRYR